MLKQNKLPLEIKPVNLPREHQRFRALENWPFQVLYQNKPLAEASVLLETSKGSREQYQTDENGLIDLVLADDFKQELKQGLMQEQEPGQEQQPKHKQQTEHKHHAGQKQAKNKSHHRRRQSAHFVLSVQHQGMSSAFNAKYSPEPFQQKSILTSIILIIISMAIAWHILYRRKSA